MSTSMLRYILSISLVGLLSAPPSSAAPLTSENLTVTCSSDRVPMPALVGATLLALKADAVYNYTTTSVGPGSLNGGRVTIDFCNITVTYTHQGWNDTINTAIWLALNDWNGRFQAVGGGGYSTGFGSLYLGYAVSQGYATADTDGGHGIDPTGLEPPSWALTAPGTLNLGLIEDYGQQALADMTTLAKSVIKSFYGQPAEYSYFNGCSGGGRQGMMLAQRYPDYYDGIAAASPALHIHHFIPAGYYPQLVMNEIGYYPAPCEVSAFTKAAVEECDALDGLKDGIISHPELCNFTAGSVVDTTYFCESSNTTETFTSAGAAVVEAAWSGLPGEYGWPGLNKDAELTNSYVPTICSDNSTSSCTLDNSPLLSSFIKYFIYKDPERSLVNLTTAQLNSAIHTSLVTFQSSLGAGDPDLGAFKAAGGKLISWHGLADVVIPIKGSEKYFDEVKRRDPEVNDYFRFFEAPGVAHCTGGNGYIPNESFKRLVRWVEHGEAPETLVGDAQATSDNTGNREICLYPRKQVYHGGKASECGSFTCI